MRADGCLSQGRSYICGWPRDKHANLTPVLLWKNGFGPNVIFYARLSIEYNNYSAPAIETVYPVCEFHIGECLQYLKDCAQEEKREQRYDKARQSRGVSDYYSGGRHSQSVGVHGKTFSSERQIQERKEAGQKLVNS